MARGGVKGSTEWPLVVFTVFAQAAAGACVARAIYVWLCLDRAPFPEIENLTAPVLPAALVLLVVGGVVAALHLGRPGSARFALSNLRSSWLSREMALGTAFGAAVAAHIVMRALDAGSPEVREGLGFAAAILGIFLVHAISKIYRIRTVPAWDTRVTPVAFFGTAYLLGTAILAVALAGANTEFAAKGLPWLALTATLLVLGILLATRLHLRALDRLGGTAAESAAIVRKGMRRILRHRIVSALLGAALLLAITWPAGARPHPALVTAAFVLLLASELLGRLLFFASHRRVGL